MIIAGMRAGIDEYLYLPFQKNLSELLLKKLEQYVRNQFNTTSDRKTVGFLAAKGGCGATTVACHVATELGKRMHQTGTYHVLLADMDVTGGAVRFLMRSKTPLSVLDAMANGQTLDIVSWNNFVSNGHPGLEVIPAPAAFCAERLPGQREIERVLNFARSRYQWTVLDLGCSLTPYTASILESINELYLVASPDVLSLYGVKQILQDLQTLEYSMDRVRLILNRSVDYADKFKSEDLEEMLGVPVFWKLPNDHSALSEAYSAGNLLPPRSALGRQISMMATNISGIDDSQNAHPGHEPWYRKFRGGRDS
jgi:pilus assembly protein CpaE